MLLFNYLFFSTVCAGYEGRRKKCSAIYYFKKHL